VKKERKKPRRKKVFYRADLDKYPPRIKDRYKVGIPKSPDNEERKPSREIPKVYCGEWENTDECRIDIKLSILPIMGKEHLSTGLYDMKIANVYHKMSYDKIAESYSTSIEGITGDKVRHLLKKFDKVMEKYREELF